MSARIGELIAVGFVIFVLLGHYLVAQLAWGGGLMGRALGDYNYPDSDPGPMKAAIIAWLALISILAVVRRHVDPRAAGFAILLPGSAAIAAQDRIADMVTIGVIEIPVLVVAVMLFRRRDFVYVRGVRQIVGAIGVAAGALSILIGLEAIQAGLRGLAIDQSSVAAGVTMLAAGPIVGGISVFSSRVGSAGPWLLGGIAILGVAVAREHYATQAVLILVTAFGAARANAASRRPFVDALPGPAVPQRT